MCQWAKVYEITVNVLSCVEGCNQFYVLLDVLLHSAGVGRTGTFIAVDAMMQRLKERDDLDIYTFVTQMRTKRTFMVQNLVRSYRLTTSWVFSFTFVIISCRWDQNKAITI